MSGPETPEQTQRHAQISTEACEWWLRVAEDDMSRAMRERFVQWLCESPIHVAELLKIAEVHAALGRVANWDRIETSGWESRGVVVPLAPTVRAKPQPIRTWNRGSIGWLGGALATVVAAIAIWYGSASSSRVIETGRGDRRGITLDDGSIVQIDPLTRIRIRLERGSRDIELERGRAVFHVAKDPSRPFLVHAGLTLVRAVGTQFGVEQARNGIVVTVAEGRVAVLDDPKKESVFLTAGQQITVPRQGPTEPVKTVDSGRELGWAEGHLVFDNATIGEAVEVFNRYNVIQLHVTDVQLRQKRISGVFEATRPDSFVAFIQSVVKVRVSHDGLDTTISL